MTYKEEKGDLIIKALAGEFDVITHGCNCLCNMKSGIAPLMASAFGCDKFEKESEYYKGDFNKLGTIDYEQKFLFENKVVRLEDPLPNEPGCEYGDIYDELKELFVINSYTQYFYGTNLGVSKYDIPLDYDALRMCMRKINHSFKGKRIGLPKIGAGRAKGDWNTIQQIIKEELVSMDIVIVNYE